MECTHEKEVNEMRALLILGLALVLTAGVAFAEGGNNHGTTGSGGTYTGSGSQGTAAQPRTGR